MAENNSSAPLLPCPFCGASAAVQNESPADNSGGYFVECKSCGASTNLRYACGDDPVPMLVAQWNTRAPQAVAAQAPAAVAVPDERAAFECDWLRRHYPLPMNTRLRDDGRYGDHIIQGQLEAWCAGRAALAATPARPATEDSSAGDMAEVQAEPVTVAPAFDASTSAGGRGFVAWYFENAIKRHDFRSYIREALAADFACALAKHLQAAPQAQPADALDARRGGKWLTVVYQDVQPGDEAREIGSHQKVAALSWSHALDDRDAAMAAAQKGGNAAKEA